MSAVAHFSCVLPLCAKVTYRHETLRTHRHIYTWSHVCNCVCMPAPLLCTHSVCYMPAWSGSFDHLPCYDVCIKVPHSCLWTTQTFIVWIFKQLLTVVFRLFLISLMNRAAVTSPETCYFFIRVYAHS